MINIRSAWVSYNGSTSPPGSGGIHNNNGSVTIIDSVIEQNTVNGWAVTCTCTMAHWLWGPKSPSDVVFSVNKGYRRRVSMHQGSQDSGDVS